MSYYTERHGMRAPIERTSTVTIEMYALLFDCCTKYYDNIAWKYPAECPDGNGCCGLDYEKFNAAMTFEIPTLYRDQRGMVEKPRKDYYGNTDEYDQYALLDLIELIASNCIDISSRFWHGFFRHDDLSFGKTHEIFNEFRAEINSIFEKTGLLYTLTPNKVVERVVENGPLSAEVEKQVQQISELGTRELVKEAIALYKTPHPLARKDSVEKIWDALERLKTYYANLDKKVSTQKVVEDMSNGQAEFMELFDTEFRTLTKIGNSFRIRHHETDKIEIKDGRHYDYFFNRCLSLIALAIQYLH